MDIETFYEEDEDFKRFVDANAKTYGKSPAFIMDTPTTREYYKYLKGRRNGKESKQEQGRDISQADQG